MRPRGRETAASEQSFPSKEWPEEAMRRTTVICNDGDMSLFNGLRCAPGVKQSHLLPEAEPGFGYSSSASDSMARRSERVKASRFQSGNNMHRRTNYCY
jgi:hypothetical protein